MLYKENNILHEYMDSTVFVVLYILYWLYTVGTCRSLYTYCTMQAMSLYQQSVANIASYYFSTAECSPLTLKLAVTILYNQ